MNRLHFIQSIAKEFSPIPGLRSFQKLVYLVQRVINRYYYHFNFNIYGPVSYQLSEDTKELIDREILQVHWDVNISNPVIFVTNKSLYRTQKISIQDQIASLKQQIEPILANPKRLEFLTSVDYVIQKFSYDLETAKNYVLKRMVHFNIEQDFNQSEKELLIQQYN